MPLHFAAARSTAHSPIARALARRAYGRAANDNGIGDAQPATHEELLNAALRHFSEHGLGSAHEACRQADEALKQGDRQGFDWWIDICRTLDRRMADRFARNALRRIAS